jgi:hypothetical protein
VFSLSSRNKTNRKDWNKKKGGGIEQFHHQDEWWWDWEMMREKWLHIQSAKGLKYPARLSESMKATSIFFSCRAVIL